jgi:hypothetical protein
MLERREQTDLAQKALCSKRRCEVVVENLDGNVAILREITRKKHGCHPSATKLTLDHESR